MVSGTSNILNQPKGLTAQIPTPNSSSMKTISFYDHLFLKIIQNKNPEILYILICSGWISKISQNLDDVFFFITDTENSIEIHLDRSQFVFESHR